MDAKLPHIPDYKPSGVDEKPHIEGRLIGSLSKKKKMYLGALSLLVGLVVVGFFAVGQPVKTAKKAFTDASQKGYDYNLSQYNLTCSPPNTWYVPEADPTSCADSGSASGTTCGQLCPADRQTGTVNPEGHVCCRPPQVETIPTSLPTNPPASGPTVTTPTTPSSCEVPKPVGTVTITFPSCGGQ